MFGSVFARRLGLALCALLVALAPLAAQGLEFSFSNELSSDIVNVESDGAEFAGIEDEVIIDLESARVDLGIDMIFGLYYDSNYSSDYRNRLGYSVEDFDWYAAFRPLPFLEFGLSKDYEFAGSYMYVEDDNVGGGKMGSDGLSIAFIGGGLMPMLDGLKVAFTMPFSEFADEFSLVYFETLSSPNFFAEFKFGIGAEYSFGDLFTVGVAAKSYYDNDYTSTSIDYRRQWAVSASAAVFPIDGLSLYLGYSFNDYEGLCDVYGKHLLNFSASYEADRFAVGVDFLTNFGAHAYGDNIGWTYAGIDSDYDIYAALYGEFRVMDPLLAFLTLTYQNAFEETWTVGRTEYTEGPEWAFSFAPGVEFDTGRFGSISFEVEVGFDNGGFDYVCFPLSWTYEF